MLEIFEGYPIGGCLPDEPGTSFPVLSKVGEITRPPSVDLRAQCSPVENQQKIGSCVANAVVGALEYHQIRAGRELRDLSRLFVYYNARKLAGRLGEPGCSRRIALASVLGWGVCPEAMWPYQEALVEEEPGRDCYKAAENFRAVEFAELEHGDPVKDALASGLPVVFGMATPKRMMAIDARHSGQMKPPANGQWEGANSGHAMLLVGYDDRENAFLVRNSWGADWGLEGHVWIDYAVLDHYTRAPVYPNAPKPFAVGNTAEHRAYQVSGPSADQFLQAAAQTVAPALQAELQTARQSAASALEDHLSKAKQSIRDRLRGPGAGGGY
ncbi:C1 family peptidase [Henriciella aquimarina]|uniref:C1 family peptidase n=1 Tax=Henriciella aquimarina TaxID=545261 RepID=UPI000A05C097|nr:C1 family peptidase [Henriciella aquimarina]